MRDGSDARVLVVEDDASIRELVEMILEDSGFDVITASNGEDALRTIERAAPHAILLDMRMPVMDGWDFVRAYRSRPGPHAPIVVMTAAKDARSRAEEVSAEAFVAKPFDPDTLVAAVRRQLDRRPSTGRSPRLSGTPAR